MASSMPLGAVPHVLPSYNGGGKPPRQYAGVNLFVKNLDATFDDQKLWELFSKFGLIISCKVQMDENGVSKGFGFVCFTNVNEASLAIAELNGRVVGTKPLYVNVFESKEERAKNRVKKAVEYLELSSDMVKPSSYEQFLQLSMARGRGRGRSRGRSSDPMLAPLSPELPFGTGVAMAARTPFSPPRARLQTQPPELLMGPGMVNTMAAHTSFLPPCPQTAHYYTGMTGAMGAMDISPLPKSACQSVAKQEEEQFPTEDRQAMAQLAASFIQKLESHPKEMNPIYEQTALSPNRSADDSGANLTRYASVEFISPFVYRGSASPDYRAAVAGSPSGSVN